MITMPIWVYFLGMIVQYFVGYCFGWFRIPFRRPSHSADDVRNR